MYTYLYLRFSISIYIYKCTQGAGKRSRVLRTGSIYLNMYIYSFIYLYTYIDIHRAPAKEVESHKPAGCIDFYLNICILIY